MKKMIAFLFLSAFLAGLNNFVIEDISKFDKFSKALIVSEEDVELQCEKVQNGQDFYYIFENEKDIVQMTEKFEDVKGINLYFDKNISLTYFSNQINYFSKGQDVEDMEVYYGYYPGYKDFRFVDGKKINVQLVKTADCWIMGFPLILTGF